MKVIIAGSRSIDDPFHVMEAIKTSGFHITEVVSGRARGVDWQGEQCAKTLGLPVKEFPAKWDKYGRGAGFVRNQQMGWYADALIAVWDGKSTGTKHMIDFMKKLKKPVFIYIVNDAKEHSN
ncbi:MAG: hypothetical protein KGI27_10030 [Thaumarchaeota archaeon]|nr:hypothetical protein [Nitrososphaerota archaeon]